MAKPVSTHSIKSLTERCVEYGDCLIWQGYSARGATPQVYDGESMVNVRRMFSRLLGVEQQGGYYAAKCGEALCVKPEHTSWANSSMHMSQMARHAQTLTAVQEIRKAKISNARRKKLTPEALALIYHSNDSCAKVARQVGVSKSLVSRYRIGRVGNTRATNIWRGLM